jgi:fructose/tagatose bisphosphate aldolase
MLKITFAEGFKTYLEAKPKEYDPIKLQKAVHADVVKMAKRFMEIFGSAGRA